MKYLIYTLIDPRTDRPFYVGATVQNLKNRLSGHISDKRILNEKTIFAKKHFLIQAILKEGKRPIIQLEKEVLENELNRAERQVYEDLIKKGENLLQDKNCFHYTSNNEKEAETFLYRFASIEQKRLLKEIADKNNNSLNQELNVAVENHIKKEKYK